MLKLHKFSAVALVLGTAGTAHAAASVASPPLVVGGMLVGLVLLALFIGLLARTFRNMQAARVVSRLEAAQHDVEHRLEEWHERPDVEILRALLDGLRESIEENERQAYASALSEVSGRFFGADLVAWEVWFRKDAAGLVSQRTATRNHAPPAGEFLPVT